MNQTHIDRHLLEEKIKTTPQKVFLSLYLAVLLGVLLGGRIAVLELTQGTFSRKTLIFIAIIVGVFAFNGFALLTRNRLSYCLLVLFTFMPMWSSLAGAIHLVALIVTGQIATSPADTIVSLIATLQLLTIIALYLALASRTTSYYVWHSPPPPAAPDH